MASEPNIYTASGQISVNETYVVLNSASPMAMTLANGVLPGAELVIKRFGSGVATVAATIDGAQQTLTLNASSGPKECVRLKWCANLSTYLIG